MLHVLNPVGAHLSDDGGVNLLPVCDLKMLQVWILHYDVKVKKINFEFDFLQIWNMTSTWS